jgi:hypothetical protein
LFPGLGGGSGNGTSRNGGGHTAAAKSPLGAAVLLNGLKLQELQRAGESRMRRGRTVKRTLEEIVEDKHMAVPAVLFRLSYVLTRAEQDPTMYRIAPGQEHGATAFTAVMFLLTSVRVEFLRQAVIVPPAELSTMIRIALGPEPLDTALTAQKVFKRQNLISIIDDRICFILSHAKRDQTAVF